VAFNPQILVWARQTAGLSLEEAARALGFKDTHGRTATERLEEMETGELEPSRSVLLNMARAYHRSLLVFYLQAPPRIGDRGQDFRRAPGVDPLEYDPTLDALIRDIRGRQGIVRDLREQAEARPIVYVASAKMDTDPMEMARRIADKIGFSLAEFRRQATLQGSFSYLREKVEASGAFVLLLGNLGSYHTNIPSSVFRGYAIADPIAPFIVINDQDAAIAWAFTVLHELTHVWLGATGVSDGSVGSQLEAYCNSVAGEMLLPDVEIRELRFLARASLPDTIETVAQFARSRKISRAMVAYKLQRVNIISRTRWQELDKHYDDEWRAAQEQHQQRPEKDREGGPSYYVVKRHRLGHALLSLVKNSLAEGFLTHTKAGQVLGVKPRNVDPLVYVAGMRASQ
jgi:Zn-dependent peptidase ImmA (M78 family)/transcriptional regulator with XRE-family HTH domain